jgi:hypothetical protein
LDSILQSAAVDSTDHFASSTTINVNLSLDISNIGRNVRHRKLQTRKSCGQQSQQWCRIVDPPSNPTLAPAMMTIGGVPETEQLIPNKLVKWTS